MDIGLYSAAMGMIAEEAREQSVTLNVAHAGTAGFRREAVAFRTFDDYLANAQQDFDAPAVLSNGGAGVKVDEILTIQNQGMTHFTDDNLDFAIEGKGFFVVSTPRGEMYTRSGSFRLGPDGTLRTISGYPIMGEQGQITITDPRFEVDERGNVVQNGTVTDTLRVTDFSDPSRINRAGEVTFAAADQIPTQAADYKVLQKYLEDSNVNIFNEMVNMVTVMRTYEMNQRSIRSIDETLRQAVSEVGSVRV